MKCYLKKLLLSGLLLIVLIFGASILSISQNTMNDTDFNTGSDIDMILENIKTSVVEVKANFFEIYGNDDLTEKEFRDIVDSGEAKIYIHYRTDCQIDLSYDALIKVKTSEKIYSYEFIEKEKNGSISTMQEIKSFISDYSNVLLNFYNSSDNSTNILESQKVIESSPNETQTSTDIVVEKEYVMRFSDKGYITYHIAIVKYRVTAESIIYIVNVNNNFVPGVVAKENNEIKYSSYKNKEGFAHVLVEQAYDATDETNFGKKLGAVPYKKDYWPLNESYMTTVGSTTSRTEPTLSVQPNSSNLDMCEWYYSYKQKTAQIYNQPTNYMFEMSNSAEGMSIGDFRLKLDYKFVVKKGLFAQTSLGSTDLLVRAGTYEDIYSFRSGMNV
ncbi:MAG: hypothetical protein WCS56_04415 [Bacilli bacterium]